MSDHVGFARVFIELINENDNRPIFSKPLYNISLPENTAPGTSLLRILVSALKHPCRVCCDLFLKFRLRVFHWVCFTVGVFLTCLWAYSVSIQVLIMDDSLNYQDSLPQKKNLKKKSLSMLKLWPGLKLLFIAYCESTFLRKQRMCFTILSHWQTYSCENALMYL